MGKIGEEVAHKVKSAITAKLIELGVEIDSELPDYIMVLVANRKSQEQMEADLRLFLAENTSVFTSWLVNVLNKLQQVTLSSKLKESPQNEADFEDLKTELTDSLEVEHVGVKHESASEVTPMDCSEENHKEQSDSEEIEFERNDNRDKDIGRLGRSQSSSDNRAKSRGRSGERLKSQVRLNERSRSQGRSSERARSQGKSSERARSRGRSTERARSRDHFRSDRTKSREYSSTRDRTKSRERRRSSERKNSLEEKDRSSQRTKLLDARDIIKRRTANLSDVTSDSSKRIPSLVVHKNRDRGEKRHIDKTLEPVIPSLVRTTSRPRPISGSIQPSKKLLLLAVADAEKSVSSAAKTQKERLIKYERPEKIRRKETNKKRYGPAKNIYVTLQNPSASSKDELVEECHVGSLETAETVMDEDYIIDSEDVYLEVPTDELYAEEDPVAYESTPEFTPGLASEYNPPLPTPDNNESLPSFWESEEVRCVISLESSPEKSEDEWRLPELSAELGAEAELAMTLTAQTAETFEWGRLGPPPVAAVRPLTQQGDITNSNSMNKSLERCSLWPACTDSSCTFFHPNLPCKTFPLCKYGDKCLFIHPDCKYGNKCLNSACKYLHQIPKVNNQLTTCMFYPNCKNPVCPYYHPKKVCKFGKGCARSDCFFFHPKNIFPPKELLSWRPKSKDP